MLARTEHLRGAGNCATSHARSEDERGLRDAGTVRRRKGGFRGAGLAGYAVADGP